MKHVPDNYTNVTPYLCCKNAAAAMEFYKSVFDAIELMRIAQPDGTIGHAELKIGESVIMLADEFPDLDVRSPQSLGGSAVSILVYVENVDAVVAKALASGSKLQRAVADQFYGDRSGKLVDPFGHVWMIATHIEDVPPEEMQRRAAALYGDK